MAQSTGETSGIPCVIQVTFVLERETHLEDAEKSH